MQFEKVRLSTKATKSHSKIALEKFTSPVFLSMVYIYIIMKF